MHTSVAPSTSPHQPANMKLLVATALVIISMVSAEPPNNRRVVFSSPRQQEPYQARGFRPAGPAFNLPARLQQQQQQQITPAPSYGPPPANPPASYGPPPEETETTEATTEPPTTTNPQAENIVVSKGKLQQQEQGQRQYYVVIPQAQARLVTAPKEPLGIPIQAVPAFAKIQEAKPVTVQTVQQLPVVAKLQQFQSARLEAAAVPVLPLASSAYATSVFTPFSASVVQVFQ